MTSTNIRHKPGTIRKQATQNALQDTLLLAGVLSSVVYVTFDLLSAARYPGYSLVNQAISELSAIGAPPESADVWRWLGPLYGLLFVAFTIGVLRAGRANRALRRSAWIMLAFVGWGMLWPFFPMHTRGSATTATDVGHLILGGGFGLLILGFIGYGAFALGARFRSGSLATMVVYLATVISTFGYANEIGSGLPTPWLGLVERIMIYSYLLWVAVLSVALMRRARVGPERGTP